MRGALELGAQQERLLEALLTLASGEGGIERWEMFDLADVARTTLGDRQKERSGRGIDLDVALRPSSDGRRPGPSRKPGGEPRRQRPPPQRGRRQGRGLDNLSGRTGVHLNQQHRAAHLPRPSGATLPAISTQRHRARPPRRRTRARPRHRAGHRQRPPGHPVSTPPTGRWARHRGQLPEQHRVRQPPRGTGLGCADAAKGSQQSMTWTGLPTANFPIGGTRRSPSISVKGMRAPRGWPSNTSASFPSPTAARGARADGITTAIDSPRSWSARAEASGARPSGNPEGMTGAGLLSERGPRPSLVLAGVSGGRRTSTGGLFASHDGSVHLAPDHSSHG